VLSLEKVSVLVKKSMFLGKKLVFWLVINQIKVRVLVSKSMFLEKKSVFLVRVPPEKSQLFGQYFSR